MFRPFSFPLPPLVVFGDVRIDLGVLSSLELPIRAYCVRRAIVFCSPAPSSFPTCLNSSLLFRDVVEQTLQVRRRRVSFVRWVLTHFLGARP